jgi:hypothetical protein
MTVAYTSCDECGHTYRMAELTLVHFPRNSDYSETDLDHMMLCPTCISETGHDIECNCLG